MMREPADESEDRYQKLFDKLDRNQDGKIDVRDLVTLLDEQKICRNKESSLTRAKVFSNKKNKTRGKNLFDKQTLSQSPTVFICSSFYLKKLISGKKNDETMNFTEFVQFMQKREKRLELIFNRIDADNDSECGNKQNNIIDL